MQAARPTMRPADRSVPLVIRQPDTPQAMMKRGDTLMTRLVRLRKEKKLSFQMPTPMASTAISRMMALLDRKFFTLFALNLLLVCSIVLIPPYSNCVASSMMFSWLALSPSIKPVTRPSHMTMMRSDMPMSSPISEEIMMMLLPCLARSAMMQ